MPPRSHHRLDEPARRYGFVPENRILAPGKNISVPPATISLLYTSSGRHYSQSRRPLQSVRELHLRQNPCAKTDPCVPLVDIQYCDTEMRFTWDPVKARKNQRSHGVSFTTASEIFDDPNHVVGENYFMQETGEQRFQVIGMTRKGMLLLVVFVEPGSDVIRIISPRKAVEYEESIYHDQFR